MLPNHSRNNDVDHSETALAFDDLGLIEPLLRALRAAGHRTPTPIQLEAIPPALAGRDVLGCAQTGTGKTAAFALPVLQRLLRPRSTSAARREVRALVISPTRELASQIGTTFARYGAEAGIRTAVVFGGVAQGPQLDALRRGVDVLVATPGRLVDLLTRRLVSLEHVEMFILDEADRMLDDGFLPAIRRVVSRLPRERQTLLFSATMPKEILPLADELLRAPARVEVAPVASTPDSVGQSVYFVDGRDKRDLLRHLLAHPSVVRAVVFTRTKHGADRTARHIDADAIHGDKSQAARERALARFREGRSRVLVATDLAARGIDVPGVSHVINYDMPVDPEAYVHRIGRTARAGADGIAISLCSAEERDRLASIEKLIRRRVPAVEQHPFRSAAASQPLPGSSRGAPRQGSRGARRSPAWPT